MAVPALYTFPDLHPYPKIERQGSVCFPNRMNQTDFEEAGRPRVSL